MSGRDFREVSGSDPCPACGKSDWCARTREGWLKCERTSATPAGFVRVSEKGSGAVFRPEDDRGRAPPWKAGTARQRGEPARNEVGASCATDQAAVTASEDLIGRKSDHQYPYLLADGNLVGIVVRWDRPDGKRDEIRPVSLRGARWRIEAMPSPRPLFRLQSVLATAPDSRVYVCEGEKCVESMRELGLIATTSVGGSAAAQHTDWSPLAGRRVVILPDWDEPGMRYARAVAALALRAGAASVCIVQLRDKFAEIPDGGDIADVLASVGGERELLPVIRASIELLADQAIGIKPPPEDGSPVLLRMSEVTAQQIRWLWRGRVARGRVTLIVGRPGEGKSFLTADLAARVTTGRPWPDESPCELGGVLLVTVEDDPADTIRPRLDAHGADVTRVQLLKGIYSVGSDGEAGEAAFTLRNLPALEAAFGKAEDLALCVIDPIGSFLGGGVDAYRENEVRAVLAPLAALAQRTDVAIVVIAHTRKSGSSFADDLALGSRAFTGIARSVLHLMRDPNDEDRRLLLPGKSNLSRPAPGLAFRIEGEPPALVWEPDPVELSADDLLAMPSAEPDSSAVAVAGDFLRDALGAGPRLASEVQEAAKGSKISATTLKRAKLKLGIRSTRTSFGGPWFWTVPEAQSGPLSA